MTVLVGRRESFNAAHQLCDPDLSDDENRRRFGKCANLHGHNYVLEVVVVGEVDQATGYVLDLKFLSDVISRQVIRDVDHRNLNTDVPWLKGSIPTTENLARASATAAGSRSRQSSRPFAMSFSKIAAACPPRPNVASIYVPLARMFNAAST